MRRSVFETDHIQWSTSFDLNLTGRAESVIFHSVWSGERLKTPRDGMHYEISVIRSMIKNHVLLSCSAWE